MSSLTNCQRAALPELLDHRGEHCLLIGHAGTGKTHLIAHVVAELLSSGRRVAVSAPTHKAAAVLSEKLPFSTVSTVHSLLGLKMTGGEGTLQAVPGSAGSVPYRGVIVVDEASMIEPALFDALLEAADDNGCRIIFVGDSAQLPPVNHSKSPVFGRIGNVIRLKEIVRQAEGSPIIEAAGRVREAQDSGQPFDYAVLKDYFPTISIDDAARLAAEDYAHIIAWRNTRVDALNRVCRIARGDVNIEAPFEIGRESMANSAGGGLGNNERFHVIDAKAGRYPVEGGEFTGWRITWAADGNRIGSGIVLSDRALHKKWQGWFWGNWKRAKQAATHPHAQSVLRAQKDAYWAFESQLIWPTPAMAMTGHKSQGSSLDVVVIDIDDMARCTGPEALKLLYVALTRAKREVLLMHGDSIDE